MDTFFIFLAFLFEKHFQLCRCPSALAAFWCIEVFNFGPLWTVRTFSFFTSPVL